MKKTGIKSTARMTAKKPKSKAFGVRRFINLESRRSTAFIAINIPEGALSPRSHAELMVNVKDCHAQAELHNSLRSPNSRQNALFKLKTMRDSLDEAIVHIESEIKRLKLRVTKDELA